MFTILTKRIISFVLSYPSDHVNITALPHDFAALPNQP